LRANAPKNADKCRSGFSQITDIHSVNGTLLLVDSGMAKKEIVRAT